MIQEGQAEIADDQSRQISRILAERAMEGALAALDAPEQRERLEHLVNIAAKRAIEGGVAALAAPEQRGRVQQVVNVAVTEAVTSAFQAASEVSHDGLAGSAGGAAVPRASPIAILMGQVARTAVDDAVRGLVADLGSHGQGPLAASIAGTARNASAAVVGGALDQLNELFPGCRGPDAVACVNRQIASMSQSAAIGFSAGLRQTIGWALLIFAGLIGLLMGLLSHWLWSQRGHAQVLRTRTT